MKQFIALRPPDASQVVLRLPARDRYAPATATRMGRHRRSHRTETQSSTDAGITTDLLETPLAELALPTRLDAYLARHALTKVRDLVAIDPAAILLERNIGKTTVAATADVLRRHLGATWSSTRRALHPSSSAATNNPVVEWGDLRAEVTSPMRDRELATVDLPSRLVRALTTHGITTVGALLDLPFEQLATFPGVGRGSIAGALAALRAAIQAASTPPSPPPSLEGADWKELFRDALRLLPERERLVLNQRSGMAGPAPTLAEIGESFGVSRERIRQIESSAVSRLKSVAWRTSLRQRLEAAAPRSVHDLLEVERDQVFDGADDLWEPFAFLVNNVLESDVRVVTVEGLHVVTRLSGDRLETRIRKARDEASRLPYPLPAQDRYEALSDALGCTLYDATDLKLFLDRDWIENGERVVGFGRRKVDEVIAYARAATGPVGRAELETKFGRFQFPDELVLIAPALFTVAERIPDWDRWRRRLPGLVREIIEREGPHRQWTTAELLPLLVQEAQLPDWCNQYALGPLLRSSEEVQYLNRGVVALPDYGQDRLYVRDALVQLLERVGGPVDEQAAHAELRGQRGFAETTWGMLRMRKPFLLLDNGRIGLAPRDVPGGADAIARVSDAIFRTLDERQQGLRATELRALLATLGSAPQTWDLRILRSVLRHDGRFRSAAGGAVGLAEWEDVRSPSQAEVLSELLHEHGGRVPIDTVAATIPTASGEPLVRGRIGLIANSIRARLSGDVVEWMPDATPSSSESPVLARFLADVPEATVPTLQLLLRGSFDVHALERRLNEWTIRFRELSRVEQAVEAEQVERLVRLSEKMISWLRGAAQSDLATIFVAALRYLFELDDAETDTKVGGLDDDEAVLEVAATVGGLSDSAPVEG